MKKKKLISKVTIAILALGGFGVVSNLTAQNRTYAMDMANFNLQFNVNVLEEYEEKAKKIMKDFNKTKEAAESFSKKCDCNTIKPTLDMFGLEAAGYRSAGSKNLNQENAKQAIMDAFNDTNNYLTEKLSEVTKYITKCAEFLKELEMDLKEHSFLNDLYSQLKTKFQNQALELIRPMFNSKELPFEPSGVRFRITMYHQLIDSSLYMNMADLLSLCTDELEINKDSIHKLVNETWTDKMKYFRSFNE